MAGPFTDTRLNPARRKKHLQLVEDRRSHFEVRFYRVLLDVLSRKAGERAGSFEHHRKAIHCGRVNDLVRLDSTASAHLTAGVGVKNSLQPAGRGFERALVQRMLNRPAAWRVVIRDGQRHGGTARQGKYILDQPLAETWLAEHGSAIVVLQRARHNLG